MDHKKHRIEFFPFYQFGAIERHLEAMARKGWMLDTIGRYFWNYRREEPRELRYAVTYFSGASVFDTEPTEEQVTYIDYCASAGWQYVAHTAQMLIFVTDRPDAVPIETDDEEKYRAICRAMRKNFLPGHIMLLVISLLQIAMQTSTFLRDPIQALATGSSIFTCLSYGLLALYIIFCLLDYFLWKRRTGRAVAEGGTCAPSENRLVQLSGYALIVLALLLLLPSFFMRTGSVPGWFIMMIACGYMAFLLLCVALTSALCKRLRADRVTHGVAVVLVCVVTALAGSSFLTAATLNNGGLREAVGIQEDEGEERTLVSESGYVFTAVLYHDPLPLRVEELTDTDYPNYSCSLDTTESFLLRKERAYQNACPDDSQAPELFYTRLTPKFSPVYDICRRELTDPFESLGVAYEMTPIDPTPWGADAAYQKRALNPYHDDLFEGYYVLCCDSVLLTLRTDLELTAAQKAFIVQRLTDPAPWA